MIKLVFFSLLFVGCAAGPVQVPQGVTGAAVGVAAHEAVDKTIEVFTPHYPLYLNPVEICRIGEDPFVRCEVAPCDKGASCKHYYPKEDFMKSQKNKDGELVLGTYQFTISGLLAVIEFCKKNMDLCVKQAAHYSGGKILIEEVENE